MNRTRKNNHHVLGDTIVSCGNTTILLFFTKNITLLLWLKTKRDLQQLVECLVLELLPIATPL